MATDPRDDDLVFPIGHLVGALGSPLGWVRRGDRILAVRPEDALSLWGLAHGDESRVGTRPWTVADLRESAARIGLADAGTHLAELRDAALLVTLSPGTTEASQFARAYRLVPLMVGLTEPSGVPDRHGLAATVGGLPRAVLNEDLFAVWRFAPLTSSVWEMAEAFSGQALDSGVPADEASVDVVLKDLLETMHVLLSQAAAYLDLARR